MSVADISRKVFLFQALKSSQNDLTEVFLGVHEYFPHTREQFIRPQSWKVLQLHFFTIELADVSELESFGALDEDKISVPAVDDDDITLAVVSRSPEFTATTLDSHNM